MNKIILIQARLSSSRYPNKMLELINDRTLIEHVYNRCCSKENYKVVVITSNEESDDTLYNICKEKNIEVFRGDLNNVIKRFIDAGVKYKADLICRVCGDSPFVDVNAIDLMFDKIENDDLDYIITENCINGFISEVFTMDTLNEVYKAELNKKHKEHVTMYIQENSTYFRTSSISINKGLEFNKEFTLTVDYPEDLKIIKYIFNNLEDYNFTSDMIVKILKLKNKKEKI